jgi:hypothetical protein
MSDKDQPTEEKLRFIKEMGMTEVEPGRWSTGWQGSDPDMQEWIDNLGGAGEEQLDLLIRAGRVQNEFDLEQGGAASASSVQLISQGPLADSPPLEHGEVALAVFVAIKESSCEEFDALDGETIESGLDDVFEQYETLPPPDGIAAALRKLGVRSKSIYLDPHTCGAERPDPRDYPGFRAALIHFPGARRIWLD